MKKLFALVLAIAVAGAQSGFEVMSLSELQQCDVNTLTCNSPNLAQIHHAYQSWTDILTNQEKLEEDLNDLRAKRDKIVAIQNKANEDPENLLSFVQESKEQIEKFYDLPTTNYSPFSEWRQQGNNELQSHIGALVTAQTAQDAGVCCEDAINTIDRLLKEREEIIKKAQPQPVTIRVITDDAAKVEVLKTGCNGSESNVNVRVIQSADQLQQPQPQKTNILTGYNSEDIALIGQTY